MALSSWSPTDKEWLEDMNKLTKFHPKNSGIELKRGERPLVKKEVSELRPLPGVGAGRGARFKYLYSQNHPNNSFSITKEIEKAMGTAHRLAPSTARRPANKQFDEVALVRGTSRGWIPQELREEAVERNPSVMEDLAPLVPDSRRNSWSSDADLLATAQKHFVLLTCGRYWNGAQSNASSLDSQASYESNTLIKDTSDEPGIVEGHELDAFEIEDSGYFTAPTSPMCSSDGSFYSAV